MEHVVPAAFRYSTDDDDDGTSLSFCTSGSGQSSPLLGGVGAKLWACSLVLAEYLVAPLSGGVPHSRGGTITIKNSNVLELGSGTGVCGIVASELCGARKVVLTDGDNRTVKLIRHNLALNKSEQKKRHAHLLCWESPADARGIFEAHPEVEANGGFDILIGSDIVYVTPSLKPLFATVSRLLTQSGCFILAHEDRFVGLQDNLLRTAKEAGFSCELVEPSSFFESVSPLSPELAIRDDGTTSDLDFGVYSAPGSDWTQMRLFIFRRNSGLTAAPPTRPVVLAAR
jgi:predicted nicotinamide N-methyase